MLYDFTKLFENYQIWTTREFSQNIVYFFFNTIDNIMMPIPDYYPRVHLYKNKLM